MRYSGVCELRYLLLGDYEEVRGRRGCDVSECNAAIVLMQEFRGNFASDDAAKDRILPRPVCGGSSVRLCGEVS